MTDEKYFTSKELIKKQLNVVIFNKRTKLMLANNQFLNAVIKNVSILKSIEELSTSEKNKIIAYKYLDRINLELIDKKTFIPYKILESPIELNDNINFLDSLAINLFGKNLDEIKILASDASSTLPFDVATPEPVSKTTNNTTQNNYNNGKYDYGYNEAVQKEQIIMQMATKRLSEEIRSGQVYLYLSKPRAVPIIKYAVSIFYGFIALINLAFIIFSIYLKASDTSYEVWVAGGAIVAEGSSTADDLRKENIFALNIFSIFICSMLVIAFPLIAISNLRGMKTNDNVKYSMSLILLSFISIIGLFQIFSIFTRGDPLALLNAARDHPAIQSQSKSELVLFEAFIILNIVISAISVMGFAFIIPYMMLRPQRNIKLQQELLNKYKDEIKSGGIVK